MVNGQDITNIIGVDEGVFASFIKTISSKTQKEGVLEKVMLEREELVKRTLASLDLNFSSSSLEIREGLRSAIEEQEKGIFKYLNKVPGGDEFEKAANLSKELVNIKDGYFLKKEFIKDIFLSHSPDNLLSYLGYKNVGELINKEEDLVEAFSALRFIESDEWMHKTFEVAYSNFKDSDFEERSVEIKVLGLKWREIAQRFVAKKHHNVSHLKEFGIIFLNPISESIPGKFLRDFALLLHYFHEISFYSKLFKRYSREANFTDKFKALLRGDVGNLEGLKEGQWLIVQRYLFKEDPNDPRLLMPRINPESLHWARGERDLTGNINKVSGGLADLSLWDNLDWVGGVFKNEKGENEVVSFDMEDNAMSLVSFKEGKDEVFTYHQKEAIWNKIFMEYLGGENQLENILLDNFDKGYISI